MTGGDSTVSGPARFSRGKLAVLILLGAGVVGASINVNQHWIGYDKDGRSAASSDGSDEPDKFEIPPSERVRPDFPDAPDAPGPLPVLHDLPPFSLVDAYGAPVSRDGLRGKIWICDFIYTYCSGPCPRMTAEMKKLHDEFVRDDVVFVSVTYDPERDTSEALREYAELQGADASRWRFLTGEKKEIVRLAHHGLLQMHDESQPLEHSPNFLLVDREGRLRGTYFGPSQNMMKRLRRHLNRLLTEESAPATKPAPEGAR